VVLAFSLLCPLPHQLGQEDAYRERQDPKRGTDFGMKQLFLVSVCQADRLALETCTQLRNKLVKLRFSGIHTTLDIYRNLKRSLIATEFWKS
jgi:hypothetical protein